MIKGHLHREIHTHPVIVPSEMGLYSVRAVTKDPGDVSFDAVSPPILESD